MPLASALAAAGVAACDLPFAPKRIDEIRGTFWAGRDYRQAPSDSGGQCSADVAGATSRTERFSATWTWTNTVIGRGDLGALQITCDFGTAYEDGYLVLTLPNVRTVRPVALGTYRVIPFARGDWTSVEDPRVAWSVASVRQVGNRFLASRSGEVAITHMDADVVRGTFRITATRERRR